MSRTSSAISRDALRKLNPNVYRAAAEHIKHRHHDFSCHALDASSGLSWCRNPYKDAYQEAFGPKGEKGHFWNMQYNRSRQNDRYTALLMMAAMVENAKASRGKKPKVVKTFFDGKLRTVY